MAPVFPLTVAAIDEDEDEDDDLTSVDRASGDDEEEHIDDPIRMYLMQMGEISLLDRKQEIASAKQIEWTRLRFRQTMLASDFLLRGAANLLQKVQEGKLRLDRTIEVSVTNTTEKEEHPPPPDTEPAHAATPAQGQRSRLRRRSASRTPRSNAAPLGRL